MMTPVYQHHLVGSATELGMVGAAQCVAQGEVKLD
jgi:hypothetical protein